MNAAKVSTGSNRIYRRIPRAGLHGIASPRAAALCQEHRRCLWQPRTAKKLCPLCGQSYPSTHRYSSELPGEDVVAPNHPSERGHQTAVYPGVVDMDGRSERDTSVGRELERTKFRALYDEQPDQTVSRLKLAFVHGIGGIGKSTLAMACASDFVTDSGSMAVMLDASASPQNPDMASVLRLLATGGPIDEPASLLLNRAARNLERAVGAIHGSTPPADLGPGETLSWEAEKRLAIDSVGFLVSAAMEEAVFGQPTSAAAATISAGIVLASDTARKARAALVSFSESLRTRDILSDSEVQMITEPDVFLAETFSQYLSLLDRQIDRILILVDKAENIRAHIYRLATAFARALDLGDADVTLLFAGRFSTVSAPDGSSVRTSELGKRLQCVCLDIPLPPFDLEEVVTVINATYLRRHGEPPPEVPRWVSAAVLELSDGLPLWVGLLSEALTKQRVNDWSKTNSVQMLATPDAEDLRSVIASILAEVWQDAPEGGNGLTLVAALAIAPGDMSSIDVAAAAGRPPDFLAREENTSLSFMRGNRLHDTVQRVVLQHLASTPEGRAAAGSASLALLRTLPTPPSLQVAFSGPSAPNAQPMLTWLRVASWADPDTAVLRLIELCCACAPLRPRWLRALLEEASWFGARGFYGEELEHLVQQLGRLFLPTLLSEVLAGDDTDHRDIVIDNVAKALYGSPEFVASLGRVLEQLNRTLGDRKSVVGEAIVGIRADYATWLVVHGFDREAERELAAIAPSIAHLPHKAWIRRVVGRALSLTLESRLRLCPNLGDLEPLERGGIIAIVERLGEIDPIRGAAAVDSLRVLLAEQGKLTDMLNQLLQVKADYGDNLQFVGSLGHVLWAEGWFGYSEEVYSSGVQANMDWMAGWLGRMKAQLSSGDTARCVATSSRAQLAAERLDVSRLSPFGVRTRYEVLAFCAMVRAMTGLTADVDAVGPLPVEFSADGDYGLFVAQLFLKDPENARARLARLIEGVGNPRVFAMDLALLEATNSRNVESVLEQLRLCYKIGEVHAGQRAIELMIISCAVRQGLITEEVGTKFQDLLREGIH